VYDDVVIGLPYSVPWWTYIGFVNSFVSVTLGGVITAAISVTLRVVR
jgi:hypothetical protein